MRRISSVLILALIGCGGGSFAESTGYFIADSAGVEIAQNGSAGFLGAGFLHLQQDLRIGEVDGPEPLQFHRVTTVTVGRDGMIYAANNGTVQVRLFTEGGEYAGTLGRRGVGPGEFQHILTVIAGMREVYVVDSRLNRVTAFAENGTVLETMSLAAGATRLLPLARSGSGWIVSVMPIAGAHIPQAGVIHQDTARIAWVGALPYDPSETPEKRLVSYPRVAQHGFAAEGGGVVWASAPWQAQGAHAVDTQGRVYVHNGSDYNIIVIGPDGRMARQIRVVHDPVPITTGLLNQLTRKVNTFFDTSRVDYPIGRAAENGRLSLPHPAVLPTLGRLLVAHDGEIWVERPARAPDPVRLEFPIDGPGESVWDLFDNSGRFMGTAKLPGAFTPRAVAGRGRVIGVLKDEFDVEYIVGYHISTWPDAD